MTFRARQSFWRYQGNFMSSKIAIVDDDPRIRTLLKLEVEDEGLEAACCSSCAELIEKLKGEDIDLVLLDLMMPEIDGIECLSLIKKEKFKGVTVMVTALQDEEKKRQALTGGATDYVLKPDFINGLPDVIRKYINIKYNANAE